jgi:hypothetical protein
MRVEIELDYEPDDDEALEIRSCTTTMQRRTVVQRWLGFTGATVQGVEAFDDDGLPLPPTPIKEG